MPITETGYQVLRSDQYFEAMKERMLVAFPGMSTQDSNLLIVLLKILAEQYELNDTRGIESYNNIYVMTAKGSHLDRAVKFAGISRMPGTRSVGRVTIEGDEGAAIEPNFLLSARDIRFVTTNGSTSYIPKSGSVEIEVQAVDPGIKGNVGANEISTVVNQKLGVRSVTNAAATEGGSDIELDSALRARYFGVMTTHRGSSLKGIIEYVRNNTEAVFVNGVENTTMQTVDGLPPKSFRLTVQGGQEEEIANAIFTIKPTGIASVGTVQQVIQYEGHEYTIGFNRAVVRNIHYLIDLDYITDAEAVDEKAIKEALIRYTDASLTLNRDEIIGIIYRNSGGIKRINSLKFGFNNPPTNENNMTATGDDKFATSDNIITIR